ncbi:MAG: GTPase HflX [Alphaproteobacteria bacterium]|nr:GTPase HflX [Alphaproteobacteria bacterium]
MTGFENKIIRTKAGIIYPNVGNSDLLPEDRLAETKGLAAAISLDILYSEIIKLRAIKPGTFFGSGIIEKVANICKESQLELLIIDADLTPIQQRNLEKALNIKIIDRTALILEIFGERAQTREGCLQVELAHLTYQRSRLVRSWTHLERQRGGAGFLGGPGETQIELDRRIIDDKIVKIKKALEKIKQTRGLQRSARKKVPYPIIALVGYTNTGKSTLFNYLTQANVFAENLLFATLDTTMRRLKLPSGREVILSDTVGFISDLPHELIMAFRATLEEVLEADIVVQVLDAANSENKSQRKDVLEVLHHLGLDKIEYQRNYVEVYNKIDLLSQETINQLQNNKNLVLTSAINGSGCDTLLNKIDNILGEEYKTITLNINASDGKLLAWLHKNAEIIKSDLQEDKFCITARLTDADYSRLQKQLS